MPDPAYREPSEAEGLLHDAIQRSLDLDDGTSHPCIGPGCMTFVDSPAVLCNFCLKVAQEAGGFLAMYGLRKM